jgi:hypothetical protein
MSMDPTSRYAGLVPVVDVLPGGRVGPCLPVRIIPPPGPGPHGEAVSRQDERVDVLAARVTGDPLAYWRLCDLGMVDDPEALVGPSGRRIVVPGVGS